MSRCIVSCLVELFWTSRLPPALVIPSVAFNVLVSEIHKTAFATQRAQGSCLFPGYKYSSKWPMLQEPWGFLEFLLQVLAGTSDLRASKTCSPFPCIQLQASSLLGYKSSVMANPHSFLFPGQCKWSPGIALNSVTEARSQWLWVKHRN